ncbi:MULTISPECIES: DUF2239 family protein [unclassified Polaromonas]|uniref:DUF2239 family protein n=1 Tax=unclassified Polaromonas TaxID=2638319 RepID=UPI000F08A2C7|nr:MULTISPECIES: DUF2239 family protein [unclassified Polaromonas]AYQ29404.1 DUF2239 family protein [Polaromonas sp. SP1]QGJ19480.1 DUF2239 family protein [Polaromonas sp. Pch-P]
MSSLSSPDSSPRLVAFAGFRQVAAGDRTQVVHALRKLFTTEETLIRVFNDTTGERIDLDLRPEAEPAPSPASPAPAEEAAAPRPVGRPKLGVVAREVTLLPRHWEWLGSQPGGASVTLRRLVDESRKASEGRVSVRASRENAYRFMSEMAGDFAGFEEATRALFAGDKARFDNLVAPWPEDVRIQLAKLAAASWSAE